MISAERMKSVRIAPLILSFSSATRSTPGRPAPAQLGVVRRRPPALLCRNLCASFSKPSKQRKAPPIISSGVTAQGASALMASAAGTRMALLTSEPFATAHTTGSSRSACDAGHLLRVEREVVAQHAGGLLGRDLGQHRDVVEDGGDVVEQGEQARTPWVPPQ